MANKTRDLEAEVLRNTFLNPHYGNIIELGCGTGKNTGWLSEKADFVAAMDFSPEMIKKAREKITAKNVNFIETDLSYDWPVKPGWANLITCSLVLEHIEDLDFIFSEASRALKRNGKFYICELHPWKQYSGSKARFETEEGLHEPQAYVHHISDFLNAGRKKGFKLLDLNEYFDNKEKENIPRLISLVFESQK
jgi:ubiquinone/menaquinone biosynthesis C-methylase UbiE